MKNEDDLKALYEDANRLAGGQPGARVREAAIGHAKMLPTGSPRTGPADAARAGKVREADTAASNAGHWRLALAASVVMVPLLGLLVSHLQTPQGSDAAIQVASNTASRESATPQQDAIAAAPPMAATPEPVHASAMPAAPSKHSPVQQSDARAAAAPNKEPRQSPPAQWIGRSKQTEESRPRERSEAVVVAKQDALDAAVTDSPLRAPTMREAGSPATVVAQAAGAAGPAQMSAPPENAQKAKMASSLADRANRYGVTFSDQLTKAVRDGDVTAIDELVKRGVPVNGLDSTGKTALIHAVQARQPKAVEVLVRLGADPLAKGKDGVSATDEAQRLGDAHILRLLSR